MTAVVKLCALALLCGHVLAQTCDGRPPNIIVVMLDDLGYHDLSIHGSADVRSPNIDKLMRDGCIFTEGYSVAGFCSPARAGFFTGEHPYHIGHVANPPRDDKDTTRGMPLDLTIIPQTLKTKGYKTAMIGKWHLGIHYKAHPLERGFDYFMGFLGSGFPYFQYFKEFRKSFEYIFEQYKVFENVKYLTDDFTRKAIRFMKRNRDKPNFIVLAYNAVHGPYDYKESDVQPWVSEQRVPHVAMIKAVDRGIGTLRRNIDKLGLTNCTMIVFTNDNGGHANGAINYPFFNFKGKLWEGGIRVPLTFTWPGVIAPGQVSNKLASLIDIYPTIQAVAKIPHSKRNPNIEGVNLLPYMTRVGETGPRRRGKTHEALFNRKVQKAIVRKGKWKMFLDIRKTGGNYPRPYAMYDLVKDVGETTNLIEYQQARAAVMRELYMEWDKLTINPPFFNGNFRDNPLRLKLVAYPKFAVRVGKEVPFATDSFNVNGVPLNTISWEIFKPKAVFQADYKELRINEKRFNVSNPHGLNTTIQFLQPGDWTVRINVVAGEWRNWRDMQVQVR